MSKEKSGTLLRVVTEKDKFEGCVLSIFDDNTPERIRLKECYYDDSGNYKQECTGKFLICDVITDNLGAEKLAQNVRKVCYRIIDFVNPGFSEMGYPEIAIEPEVEKILTAYVIN